MVKLISPEYHARLFGSGQPARVLSITQRKELAQFGLLDAPDNNPQVELPIPARVGSADVLLPAIVEKWAPLRERLGQFLQRFATAETQQAVPRRNDCPQPGWHKFAGGGTWVPVPTCMTGKVYVADYETGVVNGRWLPICAVVATERGEWYTWFNPGLWDAAQREWLVPLYPEYPDSIGVAHNAGYERSFSLPQYDWQAETGYWFCTMSLVQGLRGMNNQQIPAYRKFSAEGRQVPWVKAATPSNLSEALRNVAGVSLDKSVRTDYLSRGQGFILASESTRGRAAFHRPKLGEVSEVTEEGDLSDGGDGATVADMAGDVEWVEAGAKAAPGWEIVEVTTDPHDFRREVVDYCALDVWACAHLGARLWAEFEGEALDYRLRRTPRTSDITFAGMLLMSRERVPLSDRWKDYYSQAEAYRLKTEQYIASQLVRVSNDVCSQQSSCLWSEQLAESHKRGTAGWYKDFLADPTLGKTVVPLLLKVTWDGQPLRLVREGGKKFWQWLKPDGTVGVVPHPQDPTRYACSLLTKDLYPVEVCDPAAEQHLSVASWDGAIGAILGSARSIQNWVSLRKRVANVQSYDTGGGLLTVPSDAVHGTWSRRKAGKFWPVAPKPKAGKAGTEALAYVEAPTVAGVPHRFVTMDFDAQELRLAAALGDMFVGMAGGTPLSVSVISGRKELGTDVHTLVGKQAGISRDLAKNAVYGIIYGLGKKKLVSYLLNGCPGLTEAQAEETATKLLEGFKGAKGVSGLAKATFDNLTRMSRVSQPVTPVLKDPMSLAGALTDDYTTSKVNWLIQASGRNLLDLLTTHVDYLSELLGVPMTPVLSIHDQMTYMAPVEFAEKAAYVIALAHQFTWVQTTVELGLDTLPCGYCYPESIDIDYRLRKTPDHPCVTPTQPVPMEPYGYSMSPQALLAVADKFE